MLKNSKVSIIIPLYNGSRYINDTLDSLLNQTWQNWEAIVVNDGSIDNSKELVEVYKKKDNRIILVNQLNKGCSNAKNVGLKLAKGEFIQYLDCDDILSIDKLEKQIKVINMVEDAVAVCKTVVFHEISNLETGLEIDTDFLNYSSNPFDFLMNLLGINGCSGMVQPNAYLMSSTLAKKIGEWDESLSPSPDEDGEYFCRAFLTATLIIYTEGINYYRKDENSPSLSKQKSLKHAIGAFKTVKKKFDSIFKVKVDYEIQKIYHLQLAEVGYQFGSLYPAIIPQIEKEVFNTGGKLIPAVGGASFKFVANAISFKRALWLKRFFEKFF